MFAGDGRKHIFSKEYTADGLADLSRDVEECIQSKYNPKASVIDGDNNAGNIIVTVIYRTSDACDCQGFHHQIECPHHAMVD